MYRLDAKRAADIIEDFLEGGGDEWDDFTSIRVRHDPELDAIGLICARLPLICPPKRPNSYCDEDGIRFLRRLVDYLRR